MAFHSKSLPLTVLPDLSTHFLHHKCLPRRIHPHCLRQLLSECYGRWQAYQPWPLGYCWSGGLRQTATSLIPPDRRLPHLLLHRQPSFIRQRQGKGTPPPLSPQHVYSADILISGIPRLIIMRLTFPLSLSEPSLIFEKTPPPSNHFDRSVWSLCRTSRR